MMLRLSVKSRLGAVIAENSPFKLEQTLILATSVPCVWRLSLQNCLIQQTLATAGLLVFTLDGLSGLDKTHIAAAETVCKSVRLHLLMGFCLFSSICYLDRFILPAIITVSHSLSSHIVVPTSCIRCINP